MGSAGGQLEAEYIASPDSSPRPILRSRLRITRTVVLATVIAGELGLGLAAVAKITESKTSLSATAPPRPGTYHLRTVSKTWSKRSTSTTTTNRTTDITEKIERLSLAPGVTRIRVERRTSASTQKSSVIEVWKPSGLYYESQTVPLPGGADCPLDPSRVVLPLPLRVGLSWAADTECHLNAPGLGSLTTHSHSVSRVVGTKQVNIGDKTVDAFVIDGVDSGGTAPGDTPPGQDIRLSVSTTRTSLFAPSVGLTVQTTSVGHLFIHTSTGKFVFDLEDQDETTTSLLSIDPT